jgi:hypothetical protein
MELPLLLISLPQETHPLWTSKYWPKQVSQDPYPPLVPSNIFRYNGSQQVCLTRTYRHLYHDRLMRPESLLNPPLHVLLIIIKMKELHGRHIITLRNTEGNAKIYFRPFSRLHHSSLKSRSRLSAR